MVDIRTKRKGYWLFKNNQVKKEVDTAKRIHFTVKGKEEDHYVIYDKLKDEYQCDCKFYSIKFDDCSHIIACKEYMSDENADKCTS